MYPNAPQPEGFCARRIESALEREAGVPSALDKSAVARHLDRTQGVRDQRDEEERARDAEIERLFRPLKERSFSASPAPGNAEPGPLKRGPRPAERKDEPAAREGKKAMTLHFPPDVSKLLKMIAANEDTTLQALVGEGIDLVLVKRGHKPFGAR